MLNYVNTLLKYLKKEKKLLAVTTNRKLISEYDSIICLTDFDENSHRGSLCSIVQWLALFCCQNIAGSNPVVDGQNYALIEEIVHRNRRLYFLFIDRR